MPRNEKKYMIEQIAKRLKSSSGVFVTSFAGLKAIEMNKLRGRLESVSSSCLIVKNTLAKIALKEADLGELDKLLSDSASFTFAQDDVVKSAKALVDFAKECEKFEIRGGYLSGRLLLKDEIKRIASLPSREVLLAQAIGGISAPISGFVFVLNALLRGFVCALNQIKEKKSSQT